ncbi:MAG: thioredoxin [Bacteroidetes bacterium]|nr:thioredoxin [Bacteroidota bacterium]
MNNLAIILMAIVAISVGCTSSTAKTENVETKTEKSVVTETVSNDSKTIHLTTATFKEKVFNYEVNKEWKYEGDKPCIIDFYADWCGPCKIVAPVLEELAKEYDGKITIYKVDTEKQKELAGAFGIRSIPSLLFVPASGQPQMSQGALPKEQFVKVIEEFLLKTDN